MLNTIKIKLSYIIAHWFGLGLIPFAPGTWASLATLPLAYFLTKFGNLEIYIFVTAFITIIGIYASQIISIEMKISDPSQIVIDEVSGQLITLMFIPAEPMWYLCGFILFRFLDIRKPWPIRWLDTNIKGGTGIMLDDIVAGIFACVILLLSHRFYVMLIGGI